MSDELSSDSTAQKTPVYSINPDSHAVSPQYHVKMTTGARKIIDEEQAKMLINMIAHEFKQRPQLNLFSFEKVGLIVLKKGNTLIIMTSAERDIASKPS